METNTITTSTSITSTFTTTVFNEPICEKGSIHSSDFKKGIVTTDESLNYIYISKDLNSFISKQKECYGKNKSFVYHYLYFYGTIWYLSNVDRRYKNEYAPIHYKTMSTIISREQYSEIVDNSLKWNIIEENPNKKYQIGFSSKSYRLKEPYTINVSRIAIEDRLINSKLNSYKKKQGKEVEYYPISYQYLKMTNTYVNLDVASATKYNILNYQIQDPQKYNSNFYAISEYSDFNYRFSVDKFGNRVHTNITNLSSELRRFLNVEGKSLGQIDISNSQPLFFCLHINNIKSIPQYEKDNYRILVESGTFYEYFMTKLNIPFERRKEVKQKILASIFFDRYRKADSIYIKVFKQDFPCITEYITKLRKKDYKALARILQKTESKYIIEGFVSEFIKQFGDSNEFIATIHDSVVVKASILKMTEILMYEFFLSKGI